MKRLFIIIFLFSASILYSQETTDNSAADYKESWDTFDAFEFPLTLTYGLINGSGINLAPGSYSDFSCVGCMAYSLLGFIFSSEPVYYYIESEHLFGVSNSIAYQKFYGREHSYFYIGFNWSASFDLCFNTETFTAGGKTELDFLIAYNDFRMYTGLSIGGVKSMFFAGPHLGIELDLASDEFTLIATYTEANVFDIPVRRISAGCRLRLG